MLTVGNARTISEVALPSGVSFFRIRGRLESHCFILATVALSDDDWKYRIVNAALLYLAELLFESETHLGFNVAYCLKGVYTFLLLVRCIGNFSIIEQFHSVVNKINNDLEIKIY